MRQMHMNHYAWTPGDELVWEKLYRRQMKTIDLVSYASFKKGLQLLEFDPHYIPSFDEINEKLLKLTGWTIYPAPGLIDNRYFFEQMLERKFGSTQWLRTMSQLDYLEEPDMFHDVFGHIPLLTDPDITFFLEGLARIAGQHLGEEEVIERIARLYWYTIEFGLVQEGAKCKIYGAGILSSIGETAFCLSDEANRKSFHLETVLNTPYIKDKFQEQYFVLYSMSQLKNILMDLEKYFSHNN
jgi:phenylalanine-4-hydroxylase